ncbi:MAG: putative quinol monooxygenase [Spirochaetaceae bacterium]
MRRHPNVAGLGSTIRRPWYNSFRENIMIVRFVTVRVKPGSEADFEAATVKNHRGSVAEPGCLRFDVLKDASEEGLYYLYEVYRDEAATAAHKETAHYQEWRDAVTPMMAADRASVAGVPIVPREETAWASVST